MSASSLAKKQRTPPRAVADCAAHGLELRETHRRGGADWIAGPRETLRESG